MQMHILLKIGLIIVFVGLVLPLAGINPSLDISSQEVPTDKQIMVFAYNSDNVNSGSWSGYVPASGAAITLFFGSEAAFTEVSNGVLTVTVIDSYGNTLSNALVEVMDKTAWVNIAFARTDVVGQAVFAITSVPSEEEVAYNPVNLVSILGGIVCVVGMVLQTKRVGGKSKA